MIYSGTQKKVKIQILVPKPWGQIQPSDKHMQFPLKPMESEHTYLRSEFASVKSTIKAEAQKFVSLTHPFVFEYCNSYDTRIHTG